MHIIIIVIAAFVLLGRTLFPGNGEIIYGGDLLTQFYYWKGFLADNLRQLIIPFWNPYNFSGTPFLAHPGVAPFYPATLIYLLFPLNISFSLNYFLHLTIGGFGMYYLARKYTDKIAAVISSIAFIWSGFFSSRIYAGHVDLLTTAVWIPWVIYQFLRLSEKPENRKNLIFAVISLVFLILAGYSAYLVFTLEFIFLLLIYLLIKKSPQFPKILTSFFLVIFISLGITAVQWLPTWQLTGNSIRAKGLPYELASWGSLPLTGLKLFINPFDRTQLNKISYSIGGGPRENPFDHFPGRIPVFILLGFLILYLLNFFISKKNNLKLNPDFWFFLLVCLFFLGISFGHYLKPSLHFLIYQLIPFYRYIRIPTQNLIIPVVLIPVMVGIILSKLRFGFLKIILGLGLAGELILFDRQFIFLTVLPVQKNDKSIINQINSAPGSGRLLPAFRVISPLLDRFDLNASMLYRFETTSGYDPVILKNYYDFIDTSQGNEISSLPFFNVEIPPIDLSKKTAGILNVDKILNEDGSIVANSNYLPRFYFSQNDICRDENNKIEVLEYSLNKITLKSSADCNLKLLSGEVFYPGWRAKIDGKNTPVLISNIAFRTINLPEGNHTVEYFYYPYIYLYGAIISTSAFIIFNFLLKKYYES